MGVEIDISGRGLRKAARKARALLKAERGSIVAMLVGCLIYTFGVMTFIIPFRFPDSGVTGIAALLQYQIGIPLPYTVAAANVLLLVWAWKELSPRVFFSTIFCVALITMLMRLMDGMTLIQTDQKLLVALIGGAIKGYGGAITLRQGLSMGGTDIVVLYLQKKYGIEVGKYTFYINMCILAASIFVVGIENAMFGLVAIYASSVAIDETVSKFDRRRQILVVTKNPGTVVEFIIRTMQSGATVIDAHGGYSGEDRPIVMCLLTRRQSVDLRRFIADAEDQKGAFMVVADASEVVGRGFKSWKG